MESRSGTVFFVVERGVFLLVDSPNDDGDRQVVLCMEGLRHLFMGVCQDEEERY